MYSQCHIFSYFCSEYNDIKFNCTICVASFLIIILCPSVNHAELSNNIKFHLEILPKTAVGDVLPVFNVRLTNTSKHTIKILAIWKDPAKINTFSYIHLFRNNNEILGIKGCSNPRPFKEDDFANIFPNQSVEFDIPDWTIDFGELTPGTYDAFVTISIFFYDSKYIDLKSNYSSFNVTKKTYQ